MHIPDGFLDTKTWVSMNIISSTFLGFTFLKLKRSIQAKHLPLMMYLVVIIFAVQMISFPVEGGTSAHLIGAVFASIILGPWNAILIMLSVILLQSILFGDGGITAIGANIFNLAIVPCLSGTVIFNFVKSIFKGSLFMLFIISFIAALLSTIIAAISCSFILFFSDVIDYQVVFPAMVGIHILVGIIEGLFTGFLIVLLRWSRPDLFTVQIVN